MNRPQRTPDRARTTPRAVVALLLTGALAGLGAVAPAAAQRPESAIVSVAADWPRRDETISFDLQTANQALTTLQTMEPGDYGRGAAMVALGASGSIRGRSQLISETSLGGLTEDRVAATLALGELGAALLGEGAEVLERLSRDPSRRVAEAALVALVRSGDRGAERRVAEVAAGSSDLARAAREILAHHRDRLGTDAPPAYVNLYVLRWDAATNFGLVGGRVWRRTLLDELAVDDAFLRALVLRMVRDVPVPGRKDHLIEILMEGEGLTRISAAVAVMPAELELLVDSGAWRPADPREWLWLTRTALELELHAFFPRTFALAMEFDVPAIRANVAGALFRRETRFEDILIEGLSSSDVSVRADACYAVGVAELGEFAARLEELARDKDPWVAANALGALIRMGSPAAANRAVDILALPQAERPPLVAEYLFEVLARAAPDRDVMFFVRKIADGLSGLDRAAADAILLVHGELRNTDVMRAELPLMNPVSPLAVRTAEGLGESPSPLDVRLMAQMFPRQQAPNLNLELAVALASTGHRTPLELLRAAVWRLSLDESVLAAGIVHRLYGLDTLIRWVREPPPAATAEDMRRLGFAIGEFGGLQAVERLQRELGTSSGSELPTIQGAILGALAARTR